jgi:hypothetical protein
MSLRINLFLLAALVLLALGAAPASADKCTGAKIKAIGKKESRLLGCSAREATKSGIAPACETGVSAKFGAAYNRPTGCSPAAPSESQCETIADSCQTAVRMALPGGSGTTPSKCEASRLKAAGKLASAELGCYATAAAKGVPVDVGCILKATGKFTTAFNTVSGCTGDGNASGIQTLVETQCVRNMVDVNISSDVTDISCACPMGGTLCGTACINTSNDPNNCGSCGNVCIPLNATGAACSGAMCTFTACNPGFADCDGIAANGCETNTHVAQSTSPAIYGAGSNSDLKSGYTRVPTITNCGACGVTCDDGIACTTDLCVPGGPPGAEVGQCRHFDRAQCGGARCPGPLAPGAPPPVEPACAGVDADGDGLPSQWETPQVDPYTNLPNQGAGIDLNCDGEISDGGGDLVWHEAPSGDATKDLYVEYDYMVASAAETEDHKPLPEAEAAVVSAFSRAGVTLHIDPTHHALPHADVIYLPVTAPDPCAVTGNTSFYDPAYKGPANFDPRRSLGYRYVIFGHSSCSPSGGDGSGVAEILGNDAVVSLGAFTFTGTAEKITAEAGTFMHELGHNLRLCHGGAGDSTSPSPCAAADVVLQKPNHISSMNYLYQFSGIQRAATPGTVSPLDAALPVRVDFSHGVEPTLNEADLDETVGLHITTPPFVQDVVQYFCPSGIVMLAPGTGPIDWNCDGVFDPSVSADINHSNGPSEILTSSNEWANLDFAFQCQPTLTDGTQAPERVAR